MYLTNKINKKLLQTETRPNHFTMMGRVYDLNVYNS